MTEITSPTAVSDLKTHFPEWITADSTPKL